MAMLVITRGYNFLGSKVKSYDFHVFSPNISEDQHPEKKNSNLSWKSEDMEGEESLNDVKTCQKNMVKIRFSRATTSQSIW